MKRKILEHLFSIVFVALIFILLYYLIPNSTEKKTSNIVIKKYYDLSLIDFSDSYQKNLFNDVLNVYYPHDIQKNNNLVYDIDEYRLSKFTSINEKTGIEEKGLTANKIKNILGMYVLFLFIYLTVIIIIHYLAQSFAIIRFVKIKQGRTSYLHESISYFKEYKKNDLPKQQRTEYLKKTIITVLKGTIKIAAYLIIFSPAYVVAYSIKTSVNTDSVFFMILLAVFTNGLLINYAYKFFSLLTSESKTGYVETAIVKGLNNNYHSSIFKYIKIFNFNKKFPNHVFHHIYINAKYQNILNIKALSSFLITGLIIIEMALNIQGYMCYELLQNVLYKQYDVVIFIVLLIFFTVKMMELFVDFWYYRYSKKYENKN
ncbi:MAG: hypothetical protein V1773_00975 [bacterium]